MLYDFHKTLLKQLQKMRVKLRYIFEIRCKDSKNFLIVQIKKCVLLSRAIRTANLKNIKPPCVKDYYALHIRI